MAREVCNDISSRIEIHFSDTEILNISGKDKILGLSVNEELFTNNSTPLGVVSSNSMSIKIDNGDGLLAPSNKESIYFGKMVENTKIKLFIAVDGLELPFGIWFVKGWGNGVDFTGWKPIELNCVDIIGTLLSKQIPNIEIDNNMTVEKYMSSLFVGLGISSYKIGAGFDKVFGFSSISGNKVGDVLNTVASGSVANIYASRSGEILVESAIKNMGLDYYSLSGSNAVIDGSIIEGGISKYKNIRVYYNSKFKNTSTLLHQIKDLELKSGTNNLNNITINKNIYSIDIVRVLSNKIGNSLCVLTKLRYTNNTISLQIDNKTENKISVDLEIFGSDMSDSKAFLDTNLSRTSDANDSSLYKVDNELIQTSEYAGWYSTQVYNYLNYDVFAVDLKTIASPVIKVGDNVKLKLDKASIHMNGVVVACKYNFGSSYRCQMIVKNIGGAL